MSEERLQSIERTLSRIEKSVNDLDSTVRGNGRPGLLSLRGSVASLWRVMIAAMVIGGTAAASLVVWLLTEGRSN